MLLVQLATHSLTNRPPDDADEAPLGLWQRIRRRVIDWLTEPIPFPGMTYDITPRRERYEQEQAARRQPRSPREQENETAIQ